MGSELWVLVLSVVVGVGGGSQCSVPVKSVKSRAWAPWGRRWGWGGWVAHPHTTASMGPFLSHNTPLPSWARAPCRHHHPPLPFLPSAQQTPCSGPSFPSGTTRRGSSWVSRASSEGRRMEAFKGCPPSSPRLRVELSPRLQHTWGPGKPGASVLTQPRPQRPTGSTGSTLRWEGALVWGLCPL